MIARQAGSSGEKSVRGPPSAFRRAGQQLGHRGLTRAPRAHEEVGVVDLSLLDRVAQRAHHAVLPDDLVEGPRTVAAVEREHRPSHASRGSVPGPGRRGSRHQPAHAPEQVGLPGHPGGGHQAGQQRRAPHRQDHHAQRQIEDPAGEGKARDQVGGEAEDDARWRRSCRCWRGR